MFPSLAASTPKEMIYAGHPSVEFIFGEDDMSDLAFSISDNRLSVMK
jgi:hypothetical protein